MLKKKTIEIITTFENVILMTADIIWWKEFSMLQMLSKVVFQFSTFLYLGIECYI